MPTMDLRTERLRSIDGHSFDLAVIGAGVHGAFVAREAAAAGLDVLLLDAQDYAAGTSSRSSKMLHGGVRYLEQGEFSLVFEALRERAVFRCIAPHLTKASPFLFPIVPGRSRPGYQIRIGLTLYDLLAAFPIRSLPRHFASQFQRHSELPILDPDFVALTNFGLRFDRVFRYYDGQMDDARIVIECVRDAQILGAKCLSYAPVRSLRREGSQFEILFDSRYPEAEGVRVTARSVVNAAGPWINDALSGVSSPIPVRFSQGSHLLFRRRWPHPGVILPTPTAGRYYFIWPYQMGAEPMTLVGTTEKELTAPVSSPEISTEERDELFGYLAADLPHAGLDLTSFVGSFSGIRVLPNAYGVRPSDLSRSTRVLSEQGLFSIVGGKYTTARLEAERVARSVFRFLGKGEVKGALLRPLPGGIGGEEQLAQVAGHLTAALATDQGAPREISSQLSSLAVSRFGSEAAQLTTEPFRSMLTAGHRVIPGEVRLTVQLEEPITLQDVFRRRLSLLLRPEEPLVRIAAEELSKQSGRTERELLSEYNALEVVS